MLYALIAIAGILSALAVYSKNALMGTVGAGGWLALTYWFNTNYTLLAPTQDDPLVTTVLVACVGAALATLIIPILQDRDSDATATGGWSRVRRFVNHGDTSNGNAPKPRRLYDLSPEEYSKLLASTRPRRRR